MKRWTAGAIDRCHDAIDRATEQFYDTVDRQSNQAMLSGDVDD